MRPFCRKNHVHKIPRCRGGGVFWVWGLNRRVAANSEGSIPCPAALSDEVSECYLAQRRMSRRFHQQLLVLPLEESHCCFGECRFYFYGREDFSEKTP